MVEPSLRISTREESDTHSPHRGCSVWNETKTGDVVSYRPAQIVQRVLAANNNDTVAKLNEVQIAPILYKLLLKSPIWHDSQMLLLFALLISNDRNILPEKAVFQDDINQFPLKTRTTTNQLQRSTYDFAK